MEERTRRRRQKSSNSTPTNCDRIVEQEEHKGNRYLPSLSSQPASQCTQDENVNGALIPEKLQDSFRVFEAFNRPDGFHWASLNRVFSSIELGHRTLETGAQCFTALIAP